MAAGGIAAAGTTAFLFRRPRQIPGKFVDHSHSVGHALLDDTAEPRGGDRLKVPIVIVGAGIAGLSAGWWMKRLGFDEFVILELEDSAGGNSRSGSNEVSNYPWGAHYIPIPDRTVALVDALFSDLGVLRQGRWDASYLCRKPLGRLFLGGEWIPGIEPEYSAPRAVLEQFDRFWHRMDYYRQGGEFRIPIQPAGHTADLDQISMKSWMVEEGFSSAPLRWYVDYACRDDFGCSYSETSAWAGIHYFAARAKDGSGILTWPQGNGWIVQRLMQQLSTQVRLAAPVRRILRTDQGIEVDTGKITFQCQGVVFAAPTFLAPYLIPGITDELSGWGDFGYAPWYTANLVIDTQPKQSGTPPAWENVIYNSSGLGYVVATHQTHGSSSIPTVWTYYRALSGRDPKAARQSLLTTSWADRRDEVLTDLGQAHADIRNCVARLDIMRIGHAMIRPTPGFMTSPLRKQLTEFEGPLQFANSDVSGISIFEEAQYCGVRAAERVLEHLGYRNLNYAQA